MALPNAYLSPPFQPITTFTSSYSSFPSSFSSHSSTSCDENQERSFQAAEPTPTDRSSTPAEELSPPSPAAFGTGLVVPGAAHAPAPAPGLTLAPAASHSQSQKFLVKITRPDGTPLFDRQSGQIPYWIEAPSNMTLRELASLFRLPTFPSDSSKTLEQFGLGNHSFSDTTLYIASPQVPSSNKSPKEIDLFELCRTGQIEPIRNLLSSRIDQKDSEGKTPLQVALQRGYFSVVDLLLEKGADPNIEDAKGRRALDFALSHSESTLATSILQSKALNLPRIFRAAALGDLSEVRDCTDVNATDYQNRTPLYFACWMGQENVVHYLLSLNNVNLNQRDMDGRTAIYAACRNGHSNIVSLLLPKVELPASSYTPPFLEWLLISCPPSC